MHQLASRVLGLFVWNLMTNQPDPGSIATLRGGGLTKFSKDMLLLVNVLEATAPKREKSWPWMWIGWRTPPPFWITQKDHWISLQPRTEEQNLSTHHISDWKLRYCKLAGYNVFPSVIYDKAGFSQLTIMAVPLIFHMNVPLTFVGSPTGNLSEVEKLNWSLGTAFTLYGIRLISSVQKKRACTSSRCWIRY